MFEFTIKEAEFLNEFYSQISDYVNKSYKFTMNFLASPLYSEYRDNERLILIAVNKSVYQNLYSFLRLNDSNMQYSAFACLENAVYAIRLYNVLACNPNYLHDYITTPDFDMEQCEKELDAKHKEYDKNNEQFSLPEFCSALHMFNTFVLKSPSISSQLIDRNIFLGLSCGKQLSDELQNEVRKNLIGAYLSLSKHTKLFFNGGMDNELEAIEDELYAKFMEYVKKFS